MVASIASGTAPPNMPECDAWSRVRTVRVKRALPRRVTVSAGVSESQLPESATTITSERRASLLSERNCPNDREPYSSSPSMNRAMPRSTSSPAASRSARSEAMCAMTPALSSAAPRPYSRPPRTVGSNGGRLPERVVARRLHVVVGVEQHRRTAVARGTRREHRRLAPLLACRGSPRRAPGRCRRCPCPPRGPRPPRRSAAAWLWSKAGHAMEGMRTSAPRSASAVGMPAMAASRTASSIAGRSSSSAVAKSCE